MFPGCVAGSDARLAGVPGIEQDDPLLADHAAEPFRVFACPRFVRRGVEELDGRLGLIGVGVRQFLDRMPAEL
jgi:hypothetical protein